MHKNFNEWLPLKEVLHLKEKVIFFKEREVWWCTLGANIGFEQDGKNKNFERPVLILKKFNRDSVLAIPLTSRIKKHRYTFVFTHNGQQFSALLSQVRLISTKRF